jgi:hypothetical protein
MPRFSLLTRVMTDERLPDLARADVPDRDRPVRSGVVSAETVRCLLRPLASATPHL